MRTLHIIWMFAAGLAAALALVVFRPGSEPAAPRASRPLPLGAEVPRAAAPREAAASRAAGGAATRPGRTGDEGAGLAERPTAAPDATSSRAQERAADARAAELKLMSEGYRNRIFLHAIRERGHYCDGVLDTLLGDEGVAAWRVACGGMNAYLISVAASGALVIEPLYYGDPGLGVAPTLFGPELPQQRRVVPIEPE